MIFLTLISSSTLLAVILSLVFGQLSFPLALLCLLFGLFLAIYFQKQIKESWFKDVDFFFLLPFLILIFSQFYYIYYFSNGWFKTANPNNLGDLPFHIQMIRGFAKGYQFWPDNLIYKGESLKYPFGMDLFNSLLESLHVPTDIHLFAVGIILSLVLFSVLDQWMGLWGILLVFASGGFSSFDELFKSYPWGPGTETAWKNIILSVFITQRGFLYALPAGIYLLKKFTAAKVLFKNQTEKYFYILIWGSLGLFHLHTFFILSLFLLGIFIIDLFKNKEFSFSKIISSDFVLIGSSAALLAAPFLIHSAFAGTSAASVVHWSPSWMQIQNGNIPLTWIKNFGSWLVALIWVSYFSLKERNFKALFSVLLFFLFSHLILARWDWDQIKILLWLYIIISYYFFEIVLKKMPEKWHMLLVIFFFFSGLIQVFRVILSPPPPVSLQEKKAIDTAQYLLKELSVNETILVSPEYNHPVLFLGQKVILGYPAHAWSHGIDAGPREEIVKKIYNSEEGWQTEANRLNLKYIYFSPIEKRKYNINQADWMNDAHLYKKIEETAIYDISK